jgi:hypothetical protein
MWRFRHDERRHAGFSLQYRKPRRKSCQHPYLFPRRRVLVTCPPLLLPLPRVQLVRMPVIVRAQSFPATIRETSSRPNRHLCHRGSHNDDDHGCKIITLLSHFPLVVENRSEAAARAFHSPFNDPSKVEKPHSSHPSASGRFSSGVFLGIESPPKLIPSKTCRRGHKEMRGDERWPFCGGCEMGAALSRPRKAEIRGRY